ncbi:MAG: hypothetical protein ABIO94_13510 [Opitutaceae bacterium]
MRAPLTAVFLLLMVVLLGCTSWQPFPYGDLLFSYSVTQGAFTGVEKKMTGIYFHQEKSGEIAGYRYEKGRLLDDFNGRPLNRAKLLREIQSIGFESFDYDEEIRAVDAMIAEEVRQGGATMMRPLTMDGQEYELKFALGSVNFAMKRWNPQPEIEFYALRSPKIAKLKQLIDLFAQHYGKSLFSRG